MEKWKTHLATYTAGLIVLALLSRAPSFLSTINLRSLLADALQSTKVEKTFSFTLDSGATTSAGVFASDGTLVRTLWGNVRYESGRYAKSWDGMDDFGKPVKEGNYKVRVLSSNMSYVWEGVIGNTSSTSTGPTVFHNYQPIKTMAIAENFAYYTTAYNELQTTSYRLDTGNPQGSTTEIAPLKWGMWSTQVATDGANVYWGAANRLVPADGPVTTSYLVYVTKVADNSESILAKAVRALTRFNALYKNVIDINNNENALITGMAVQKDGNYLFVARAGINQVDVVDKYTGEQLKTLSYPSPTGLAVDGEGNIWMMYAKNGAQSVEKFAVQKDGTFAPSNTVLSGLESPLALAVSPDSKTVLVADGGSSQQLKAYTSTGASAWTFGQAGGYANGPDVTNNKFMFNWYSKDATKTVSTFVTFAPDGSFWVGDTGNSRAQHYSADRTFIENIAYRPASYSAFVDPNDPTRVFSDYLEYKVDYSVPLGPNNGSWKLVKNWGNNVPAVNDTAAVRLAPVTLSNGHTYSLLFNSSNRGWNLYELPASGSLRDTGITTPDVSSRLYPDGIYIQSVPLIGKPQTWTRKPITGFDGNGNPTLGPVETVAVSPSITSFDPQGRGTRARPGEITSSGVVVSFDVGLGGAGYHLGGLKKGTNDTWLWRTAKVTPTSYNGPYPTNGDYDLGNGVQHPGSVAVAIDRSIFWGYHGEGWRATQVNKWNHVYDDGLMVGQFGVTGKDVKRDSVPAEMSGNAFSTSVVKGPDGNVYMYQNDENWHSGVHRWKISGFDSIKEQTVSFDGDTPAETTVPEVPATTTPPPASGGGGGGGSSTPVVTTPVVTPEPVTSTVPAADVQPQPISVPQTVVTSVSNSISSLSPTLPTGTWTFVPIIKNIVSPASKPAASTALVTPSQPATPQVGKKSYTISQADYSLNGVLVHTTNAFPDGWKLDTASMANGSYTLTTSIYYTDGTTDETSSTFTVNNTPTVLEQIITYIKKIFNK